MTSFTRRAAVAAVAGIALFAGALQAKDWTKIRIGVEGAYPPFSSIAPDGQIVGFDIDIAMALCAEMKAECTLVAQDWDGIIPALLAKKYDMIVASMSITEERKQKVDFTKKYYQTPARFVAKKGSGIQITKEGLAGKKVGVQRATTHDSFLTDNFGDVVEIVRYGSQDEANLDLIAGRVDLLLADSITLSEGLLKTDKGVDFEFVGEAYSDLKEMLNGAIDAIRANGVWQNLANKYFDFDIYGS